ncbi:Aspartate/glutamate/uridylate kinase domain protein, partial [mine drainage metagenome]
VTLGRGGSDYSATAIGAILGASRVELIKRGVSVLTADPRLVPRARTIRRLSTKRPRSSLSSVRRSSIR